MLIHVQTGQWIPRVPSLGAPITMLVLKAMLSIPLRAGFRVEFSEGNFFPSELSEGTSPFPPQAGKHICESSVIPEAREGQEAASFGPKRVGLGVTLRGEGVVADEKRSQVVFRAWADFNT